VIRYIYEAPDEALSGEEERSIFSGGMSLMSIGSQQYELPPESSSFAELATNSKMRGGWGKEGYGTLEVPIEGVSFLILG
jgi:hypothetical protein